MMQLLWNRARARHEGDRGFTLVELLVVVVIIGILVAIAIPVFLSQREKAWAGAVQSDIRNAAPIAEGVFADTGSYATVGTFGSQMLKSDGVTLVATGNATKYCINGTHAKLTKATDVWSLNSVTGLVSKTACVITP